jgi:hypothetical protein
MITIGRREAGDGSTSAIRSNSRASTPTSDGLGNIYFDVTAWPHIVDGGSHLTGVALQNWPLSVAEDNDSNSAVSKYLLVPQVLIRGKENLKSSILGGG